MNSDLSGTIRLFTAIMLGIALIASAISGRPGSIIGAIIDAQDMEQTE
jgi:hypothetical protein